MKTPWPPDVVARYRAHFEQVRSEVGEDPWSVLDHFGPAPDRKAWLLLERVVTWRVYLEEPLSPPERMHAGTAAIGADVQNGGFHQYFSNSAGDTWEDVLATLRAGGDADGERHLLETVAIFPGGRPSPDRATRQAQLAAIEAGDADAMWAHFDRQDRSYYDRVYPSEETLWAALRRVPNQPFIPRIPADA